jgi:hypothetical protein
MTSPTLPKADELEVVALLKGRDGQTFDAEVHLSSAEAAVIAAQIERLTRERDEALDILLKADSFVLGDIQGWPVSVVSRGTNKWAVSLSNEVLNAAGEWEREPQPSNRTDEFLSRTRFSFADAINRARSALSGGTSNG